MSVTTASTPSPVEEDTFLGFWFPTDDGYFLGMPLNNVVLKLHRWGGLATGIVVVLLCLSGAVLLFEMPADARKMEAEGRSAPAGAAMLPASQLMQAAREAHPQGRSRSLFVRLDNPRHAQIQFRDNTTVLVDLWDGSVLSVIHEEETRTGKWIEFHVDLMLGGVGNVIVIVGTILFVLLTLLGIYLWWPDRKTMRRAFLIETRKGFKRANYDLHNVLGFYSALVVLVLSGTGILLAYPQIQSSAARFVDGISTRSTPAAAADDALHAAVQTVPGADPLDVAWETGRAAYPEATWQRVFTVNPPVRYDVQSGEDVRGRRFHTLRFAEGEVFERVAASSPALSTRLGFLVSDLHVGTLGTTYWVLAFIACVIGVTLPITGAVVWYPRWRRRTRRDPEPDDA